MDNKLKDSYQIGKILKKLTGLKFLKTKQTIDVSKQGKARSQSYTHPKKGTNHTETPSSGTAGQPTSQHVDKYLRYQKELEASKLLDLEVKPEPPGRIPKLPTGRKELMSKTEE